MCLYKQRLGYNICRMLLEKEPKKIIIIGAGISGLSAGIFAQKNGFISEIYEKNPVAGGLCRCWSRKGYNIDGCIHWLTGTIPGSSLRALWDELGAFTDEEIIRSDNFGTVEIDGTRITFWTDLEKLEKELISVSPEDTKIIHKTIKYVKNFQNMHLPVEVPLSLMNLKDLLGVAKDMIFYLPSYIHCKHKNMSGHVKKFKSPILRKALGQLIPNDTNLYSTLYAYGTVASGNGGVLKGGSDTLVNNLVNSYNEKGGIIRYNSDVKRIIVSENKAVGIELTNGEKKYADYIISANDPFNTQKLVRAENKFLFYSKHLDDVENYPIPSCLLATYSIDKEALDSLELTSTFQFETKPFKIGDSFVGFVKIRDYSYDPHFVSNGKSVVQVMVPQVNRNYAFWDELKDKAQYNKEKQNVANAIKEKIEEKFPILKDKIEILDVCTQKTFERYTRSYHGCFQPFMLTAHGKMLNHNGKIDNIKNLFLASQWGITPGGIPIAMLSGKFSIQRVLNAEKLNFHFTKKLHYKFY